MDEQNQLFQDIVDSNDGRQYEEVRIDESKLQLAIHQAVKKTLIEMEQMFFERVLDELKKSGVILLKKQDKELVRKKITDLVFDAEVISVAKETPIEELDLPLRVYNPIIKYREPREIFTVEDLYNALPSKLSSYRNLGRVGMRSEERRVGKEC